MISKKNFFIFILLIFIKLPILSDAQTIEKFLSRFPEKDLPVNLNKEIIIKSESLKFTPIPANEFIQYIYKPMQNILKNQASKGNFDISELFSFFSQDSVIKLMTQGSIFAFPYFKLKHFQGFTPAIVYLKIKMETYPGIEYYFYLLNYNSKGEIVDAMLLARKSIFTNCQIDEGNINKDSTIQINMLGFHPTKFLKQKTPDSQNIFYYKFEKTGLINSIQNQYFPYSGEYVDSTSRKKISIIENFDYFMVLMGEINAQSLENQDYRNLDIKNGQFDLITDDRSRYLLKFDVSRNFFTIKNYKTLTIHKFVRIK